MYKEVHKLLSNGQGFNIVAHSGLMQIVLHGLAEEDPHIWNENPTVLAGAPDSSPKEIKKISIFGKEEIQIFEDSKSIKNDFEGYMRVSNSKYSHNKSIDSRNNLNLWDLSLQNNDQNSARVRNCKQTD